MNSLPDIIPNNHSYSSELRVCIFVGTETCERMSLLVVLLVDLSHFKKS